MDFKDISYDAKTGVFTRKNKPIGHFHSSGYIRFTVCGRKFLAHRVAWFLTFGYWPTQLDHINRNGTDNRICNLREATDFQNAQNRMFTTKYLNKCIYYDKSHVPRYRVRVQAYGQRHHVGWYKTETEARRAALTAAQIYHGEFAPR